MFGGLRKRSSFFDSADDVVIKVFVVGRDKTTAFDTSMGDSRGFGFFLFCVSSYA